MELALALCPSRLMVAVSLLWDCIAWVLGFKRMTPGCVSHGMAAGGGEMSTFQDDHLRCLWANPLAMRIASSPELIAG